MTVADPIPSLLGEAIEDHKSGAHHRADLRYRSILDLQPDNFDALHLRGALAVQTGRLDEGIALIRRAIEVRPDHATAHRNLANALLEGGRAAEALVSFETACVLAPHVAGNHHGRANALAALGRLLEATDAQRAALRIAPGHADAWYNLGLLFAEAGRHDDALACFDRRLDLAGDNTSLSDCQVNRAVSLRASGHNKEALAACEAAVGLNPLSTRAWRNLALLLEDEGRMLDTADACARALALEPDHAETLHRQGSALVRAGQLDKGLASLQAAIEQDREASRYWYSLGLAHRDLKNHDAALQAFDRASSLDPRCSLARHGRGLVLQELGRFDEALTEYDAAIASDPERAEAYSNRGNALHALGRNHEALENYVQALALRPDYTDAMFNRGIALEGLGRYIDALECYDAALRLQPDHAAAACNRGNVLQELGRDREALESYEAAIASDANLPEAHNNLGVLLRSERRHAEAEACYRRALAVRPGYAEAWNNLGTALSALRRHEEAIAAYDEAVRLKPDYADAYSNRGGALKDLGRHREAIESFDRAIEIRPDHADAWYNRGNTLSDRNRFSAAIACFDRALDIAPGHVNAHNNRATALLEMREIDAALDSLERATALAPTDWDKASNKLFALNYAAGISPAAIAEAHRQFGQTIARSVAASDFFPNLPDPRRRLRIGYVSGDFRMHSVGYFIEPVLAAHAASGAVDVFAYANQDIGDTASLRMQSLVAGWRDIAGLPDDEVVAAIRSDRIDILIDLTGHSARSRLPVFARRAAPVQASWIGYPQTTGLSTMDWIIADASVLPPEDEWLYVERPIRLDGCYLCYAAPLQERAALPALSRGHVTFGCFNVLKKIGDPVLRAWAEILGRVPGSRLIIKTHAVCDPAVAATFKNSFAAHGGDVARLDLEGHLDLEAHRRRFGDIDLMLDPFPYNGCTSTAEALNAGVPVLSLRGRGGMMTRSGETLLKAAGLEDWIAMDVTDYVDLAVHHATDLGRLSVARSRVSTRGFADARQFTIGLEEAFRKMWMDWCRRAEDGPGGGFPAIDGFRSAS